MRAAVLFQYFERTFGELFGNELIEAADNDADAQA